jgi:hypothetical protein
VATSQHVSVTIVFNNLYFPPNIILMIKNRSTECTEYLASMERNGKHITFSWESQKDINNCENLDVGERIILRHHYLRTVNCLATVRYIFSFVMPLREEQIGGVSEQATEEHIWT